MTPELPQGDVEEYMYKEITWNLLIFQGKNENLVRCLKDRGT